MIVYIDDGDVYLWIDGKRRAITQTNDVESSAHFTYDEQRVTFIRDNNLYAVSLHDGSVAHLTNVVTADDKGPNVTLWDDKKGTASQEYVKTEERKLLAIVDERARKREEEEAKKKKEHPIKPFKLEKKQTITDAQLTPDGKYVIAVVRTENDKTKRAIVPTYITESAYTDTIPSREKVGDILPTRAHRGTERRERQVKWFDPDSSRWKSGSGKSDNPRARGGAARAGVVGRRQARVLFVRSTDNKDAGSRRSIPRPRRGRAIVAMHDDACADSARRHPAGSATTRRPLRPDDGLHAPVRSAVRRRTPRAIRRKREIIGHAI
jgi:hypothetical protein